MVAAEFVPAENELSLLLDLLGLGRDLRHRLLVRRQAALKTARDFCPAVRQRFVLALLVLSFLLAWYDLRANSRQNRQNSLHTPHLVLKNSLVTPTLIRVVVMEYRRERRPRGLQGRNLRHQSAAEVARLIPLLEDLDRQVHVLPLELLPPLD